MSSEQQKAVSKYEEVIQQLSLSKEFCKQFQLIATAASKDAKREARKVSEATHRSIIRLSHAISLVEFVRASGAGDIEGS